MTGTYSPKTTSIPLAAKGLDRTNLMNPKIQHLPSNTVGTDYFVGDLHGCYELLLRELDRVKFNQGTDRLFCVGDLADRGPDSLSCLRLLEEPWVYSVMGNHEDLLAKNLIVMASDPAHFKVDHDYLLHMYNGGWWAENLTEAEQEEVWGLIRDLPHVIVIGEGPERVNVIHAELFHGKASDAYLDENMPGTLALDLMWNRDRMRFKAYTGPERLPELSLTVCGHTPGETIRLRESHLCLDTGAFYTKKLTLVSIKKGEVHV